MTPSRDISLGVIILAAGASSRMGQPKLLLPWSDTTVLGHLIAVWRELGATQIAVVVAPDNTGTQTELNRLNLPGENRITNPQPGRGMFSSIQCAARWTGWNPAVTHWAIVLGDQPHLQIKTLRALLDFAAQQPDKICQPARNGRGRHPVLLPAVVFKKLSGSSLENLKEFLQTMEADIARTELDDAGLDFDMDTPADYERARQLFGGAQPGLVQS